MPIPYCSVHERLFDQKQHTWVNWSQTYVDMVTHLCDILDTANIDSSDYKVVPTACDRCKNIARQAIYEPIEPFEPPL
jgi:hypothetical protein